MPDVSQYNYSIREVAIALIKAGGITEGKWSLGINFGINVGNFGQNDQAAVPTVMTQVQSLNLARAPADAVESDTVVDASKLD